MKPAPPVMKICSSVRLLVAVSTSVTRLAYEHAPAYRPPAVDGVTLGGIVMRILHAPAEVAGQVGVLARAQRRLGHQVHSWTPPHPFGYERSGDIWRPHRTRWRRRAALASLLASAPRRYDIVHLHFARSFLPDHFGGLDVRYLRRRGVKVVVHFWGSDIRRPDVEAARNPHFVNSYDEDPATNSRRVQLWARLTGGHCIVADHSYDAYLGEAFPHRWVVPQATETTRVAPLIPEASVRRPVVAHAPSQLAFKGTEAVREAVNLLTRQGVQLDYRELSGQRHDDVMHALAAADVVIDQLRCGTHGVLAADAMGMGKPVVCWVLPQLLPTFPAGFPVVNATPQSLPSVLATLMEDGHRRARIGAASRDYAVRVHDADAVARRVLDVYSTLP